MTPKARRANLLVQEVGSDLVIYDQVSHQAHCLNETAAAVWLHCDGTKSTEELATLTGGSEEAVWMALERLGNANLLESTGKGAGKMLALAVGAGVLLPVVESILAPTPAAAGSF
ncbi:MAG TPA: PqqD family protein [Chloroflexota bacterium]|nr:PqqD family protein [Chloroflexota bacterium]